MEILKVYQLRDYTHYVIFFLVCDALYIATWKNNLTVLELLIDEIEQIMLDHPSEIKISDIFSPGPNGKNAIHAATINGSNELIPHLLRLAGLADPTCVLYP